MLFRALALLALSCAGLGLNQSSFHPSPGMQSDATVMRQASLSLRHHSRASVVRWMRHQPSVVSADLRGPVIALHFRSGLRGYIVPKWGKMSRGVAPLPDARAHGPEAQQSGGRALVLEPFATELGPGPSAADPEINYLHSAGYQVDALYDTQVSVAEMLKMTQYNVVYMRTHSINFGAGDGLVATGEPVDNNPAVLQYVHDGTVVAVNVSGSNQEYYAITSAFITAHLGLFPPHAITFFNGCSLIQAPDFWFALQHKNVGVMVSWDGESQAVDNYLGGAAFFGEMVQGMSVQQAIQAEIQAGYGVSNQQGTVSKIGFLGDGTITLAEAAAGSPTATPVPTLHPPGIPTSVPSTAVPATSVPAPTAPATRVPTSTATPSPPPLSFTLKQRVAPRHKQVLHIRSSPDTILHIHVDFPNGDTRVDTTATDPNGVATFSFPQHNSKIAYNAVFATVRVDAIKNGATTSKEARYRILWGKIDVAVSPRQQAVGQVITIFVHSRARTPVSVRLHFPTGSSKRMRGKTGAHGWVLLPYSVGKYLKHGNDRTVQVFAQVALKKTYRVSTTFTIE